MSFGFSVGDFFAVGQLAWSIYKSAKGAGGAFEEVSHEVIALHTAIKELEDEIENPDSILNRTGAGKKKELGLLVRNCLGVLQQLNKLLIKYKSLGTGSKKAWDRLRWGTENLSEIREKLIAHTSSLTLFLTTLGTGSLGRIEKKLDELIADVRAGRREQTVLSMADGDEDDSEEQWNIWKNELVDDGFTKVELEGHKHWIKARLQELIETGELQEEPLPEYNADRRSPGNLDLGATPAGPSKTPEHASVKNMQPKFQATVEDAKDDEDKGPGNDTTMPGDSTSRAKPNKIIATDDIAMDNEADEGSSEETDEDSDETDDTFLPSDSISNIGLNTMTMDNPASASSATREHQRSPNRSDLQYRPSTEAAPRVDGPSQQGPSLQEHLTSGAENMQHASGGHTQPRNTERVSTIPPNSRAERRKAYNVVTQPNSRPTEEVQAARRRDTQPDNRGKPPSGPEVAVHDDGIRPRRKSNRGKVYHKEPRYDYPDEESESDSNFDSTDSSQEVRRSRKETSNIQSQSRSQKLPESMKPAHMPDRSRDARTDSPPYYGGLSNENPTLYNTNPQAEPRHNPRSRSDREYNDSRMPSMPPERGYRSYIPPEDRPGPVPIISYGRNPSPSQHLRGGFPSSNPDVDEYLRGQRDTFPSGGRYEFSSGGPGGGGGGFSFSNPESIFSEFLRGQAGMGGNDGFEDLFGGAQKDKEKRGTRVSSTPPVEPTTVERPLPVSLEELFCGTHKKMKIKRKLLDEVTGKRTTHDKILEMDIKPGLKKGSKIKFKGVGDQEEGGQQDLLFVVEEKAHPLFSRDGDDLHHTITLNLLESLCGWERTVTTIDKKIFRIEKVGPTQPGSFDTYPELGMTLSKKPDTRGCFIVTYQVQYPTTFTPKQKKIIRAALSENS